MSNYYGSYIGKADTGYNHKFGEGVAMSLYSYNKKLNYRGLLLDFENPFVKNLLFNLHLFPDKLLSVPHLDSLSSWRLHHRRLYEIADNDFEKDKVKRRFLNMIRN